MTSKITALLLATHQMELAYDRLGDEMRKIENKVLLGPFGHSFEFIAKPATRVSDLGLFLLKHNPEIVHISGKGKPSEGIIFEDDTGSGRQVGVYELTGILRTLKDRIRLVFLNVCYSKIYAETITEVVDYAIGMEGPIEDEAAITFAAAFYQALAFGRTVKDAFEVANNLAGSASPVLLIRPGIDATQSFLNQLEEGQQLRTILRRIVDGTPKEEDRLIILRNLIEGKILFDEIEGGRPGEGDRQTAIEFLDRDNQLHVRLSPAVYQQVRERLFPPTPGIAPPFPYFVFIGREDALADIKHLLGCSGETKSQSNITVVRGWPGVGKTSLVGFIGRDPDIAKRFPQGVLWASLEQKPNLLSEMARWGRALGTDEILRAPTLKEATAQLAALLRHRRMLLIVDDVWDAAHALPFTEALGEQCALLVTTRLPLVAEQLATSEDHIYTLPVLTEETALKLLRILVPAIVAQHEEECRELVRDLECLPLAIHVAGSLLRIEAKLGWGVTDLISEIREGARLLSASAPQDRAEGGMLPTISALLMKSTNMLDEFTRDCFAFLGAFAPKPATFDLAAMQAVWEVDDPKPFVRKLVNHGLLEPVGAGHFQMHRILADHARLLCGEDVYRPSKPPLKEDLPKSGSDLFIKGDRPEPNLYQNNLRHSIYYGQILRKADELFKQGGDSTRQGLDLFQTSLENIRVGQAWAEENSGNDAQAAALCSSYVLGNQLLEFGLLPVDRIRWLEAGLTAARRLADRRSETQLLVALGRAQLDIGHIYEAIEFCEYAYKIISESDDIRIKIALLNVYGCALLESGNSSKPITLFEESLELARGSEDRQGETEAINNMGYAYYLSGNIDQAIALYEQGLAISQDIGDLRAAGRVLGSLGIAYADIGNVYRAVELLERQLTISRQIGDRYGEATVLGSLGDAFRILKDQDRAIECCEQALSIVRKLGDRRGESLVLINLGKVYTSIGKTEIAKEQYQYSLSIAREFGSRHIEFDSLYHLAESYASQGQVDESLNYYKGALAISREVADRRAESRVLIGLANENSKLKEFEEALAYFQQALSIAYEDQPAYTVAEILFAMGSLACETDDLDNAKKYWVECERIYRQLDSPEADKVASSLDDLKSLLSEPGRTFFKLAGFTLGLVRGTKLYRCECTNALKPILPPISYLYFLGDEEFDDDHAWLIKEQVVGIDRSASVVFVITKKRPTHLGWAAIGMLREPKYKFKILLIEDAFITEQLGSGCEQVELMREILARLGEDRDPYDMREPVARAFSFFGRESLLDLLLSRISDGQPIGIFGLRKMGKSSLLRVLSKRAPFPVAVVSLQTGRPLEELFNHILGEWGSRVGELYRINWRPPKIDMASPANSFIKAMQDLHEHIETNESSGRLGIFFDEIEGLTPRRDGSGPALSRYLSVMSAIRGIIEEGGRLSLVVSGLDRSVNHINSWNGEQNPVFNFFQEIYLPPLEEDDCKYMVCNIGDQISLSYEPQCLDEIYHLSGGHPFLARQICSLLYRRRGRKSGYVKLEELPPAVKEFIYDEAMVTQLDDGIWKDAGNVNLWGDVKAAANQSLLLDIANKNIPLSEGELLSGTDADIKQVSLINLERFHIVYCPEPGFYAARFGLLHRWLRRRKLGLE